MKNATRSEEKTPKATVYPAETHAASAALAPTTTSVKVAFATPHQAAKISLAKKIRSATKVFVGTSDAPTTSLAQPTPPAYPMALALTAKQTLAVYPAVNSNPAPVEAFACLDWVAPAQPLTALTTAPLEALAPTATSSATPSAFDSTASTAIPTQTASDKTRALRNATAEPVLPHSTYAHPKLEAAPTNAKM